MTNATPTFKEKKIPLELAEIEAKIIYHTYQGMKTNTLLVTFTEKRNVLSTVDGYRKVSYVANTHISPEMEEHVMTIKDYKRYEKQLPQTLGIKPNQVTFMSTGVDMDKLAVSTKTFRNLKVCAIATGGAKNNALRMGVDSGNWVETKDNFDLSTGTINVILLTKRSLNYGCHGTLNNYCNRSKNRCTSRLKLHEHAFTAASSNRHRNRHHDCCFRNRQRKHHTSYWRTHKNR